MRLAAALGAIGLLALAPSTAGADDAGAPDRSESPWTAAGREAVARARALAPLPGPARNAILFVGDGMGLSTVTAARILEGQRRGGTGEENRLAFERLPYLALVAVYNTDQQVPDSAGTATAMTTGVKTRAGVIGLDSEVTRGRTAGVREHGLRTLFEEAEDRGLATGVVTTTTVTHATPAAAYAHVPERGWEDDSKLSQEARDGDFPDVARQLVEWPHGDGLDVVLGGGRQHFRPAGSPDPEHAMAPGRRLDGRDLVAEWSAAHPDGRSVWRRQDFQQARAPDTRQLLGLFEPGHMRFELERAGDPAGEPSLAEMTRKAIEILSARPGGYVLLVEGGRIDHAHHLGNAHRALVETIAFSDAVRAALSMVDLDDTLVVVTADHGHTLGFGGYPTRGNPILGVVVENDPYGNPRGAPAGDANGQPYTALGYQNGPGHRKERPDLTRIDPRAPDYLQEAAVPLRSETHSGEDIPVYAGGPGAHLFHGVQEQSYIYHAIVDALGWTNREPQASDPGADREPPRTPQAP